MSPDGELVAVVSTDGKARLLNLADASFVKEITVDDNAIWSVAFSPDGRHLATASSDEVVALWDIATGKQLAAFGGHSGGATDITYLTDGVTLVVVDRSGNLHLWDTKSRRRLTEAWPAHAGASWRIERVHAISAGMRSMRHGAGNISVTPSAQWLAIRSLSPKSRERAAGWSPRSG